MELLLHWFPKFKVLKIISPLISQEKYRRGGFREKKERIYICPCAQLENPRGQKVTTCLLWLRHIDSRYSSGKASASCIIRRKFLSEKYYHAEKCHEENRENLLE